jgi:hypothetical protein
MKVMKIVLPIIALICIQSSDYWRANYYVKNETQFVIQVDVETNYPTDCKTCQRFVIPPFSSRLINYDVDVVPKLPEALFKRLQFKMINDDDFLVCSDVAPPEWFASSSDNMIDYTLSLEEGEDHHSIRLQKSESILAKPKPKI